MKQKIYSFYIVLSGCLWGTMGYFRRALGDMGLDSFGVVFVRCFIAAVFYGIYLLINNPRDIIVKPKDIWCFLGTGIFSLLFFSTCYFQAMNYMSLSAAAILLYTAPIFVIIISAIFFKEKITGIKILSLMLAFSGCCLVSGITGGNTKITTAGLLYGLGSGFGYALYSIFSRFALERGYSSLTVNFWSCTLAFIGSGTIWGFKEPIEIMTGNISNSLFCILAGFITCFLPYALYTYGLTRVELGKASIMASIEPVVATVIGIIIYSETLDIYSALGIVLILFAITMLYGSEKKKNTNTN